MGGRAVLVLPTPARYSLQLGGTPGRQVAMPIGLALGADPFPDRVGVNPASTRWAGSAMAVNVLGQCGQAALPAGLLWGPLPPRQLL